jgi:hypothetical protein
MGGLCRSHHNAAYERPCELPDQTTALGRLPQWKHRAVPLGLNVYHVVQSMIKSKTNCARFTFLRPNESLCKKAVQIKIEFAD